MHHSMLPAAAVFPHTSLHGMAATRAARSSTRRHLLPRSSRLAQTSHSLRPSPSSHGLQMGFYCILVCNGSRNGPITGLRQVVCPQPQQDWLSWGGRGGCSSAGSQLWPLTVKDAFFLHSVSPGCGLFPGRKLGKSTLLKRSGGLCSGKPSGFAKQPTQIRVGGCKVVAFEHCEAAPVPPLTSRPTHPSLGVPLG